MDVADAEAVPEPDAVAVGMLVAGALAKDVALVIGDGKPVFVGEPVAVAAVDAVVLAEEVSDSAGLADASASPASDGAEEAAAAGEKVTIADRVALAERDRVALAEHDRVALSERERVAECDGVLLTESDALVVIEDDSDEVGLVVTLTDAEAEDVAVEVAMAVQKTCDPPPVETVDEVQPVAAHAVQ